MQSNLQAMFDKGSDVVKSQSAMQNPVDLMSCGMTVRPPVKGWKALAVR